MSRWDGLVPWYKRHEQFSLQSTVTCLAMTESYNAGAILEVGCGPGLHSEFIARNYLKEGGVLVSCDFSKEMVIAMKDRYSESDFTKQPGNVVNFDTETDYVGDSSLTVQIQRPGDGPRAGRQVFGCRADNMRLPF